LSDGWHLVGIIPHVRGKPHAQWPALQMGEACVYSVAHRAKDWRTMPISYFQHSSSSCVRKVHTIRSWRSGRNLATHWRCQPASLHLLPPPTRRRPTPNPQTIKSRSPAPQSSTQNSLLQDSPRTQQKVNERQKGAH
jgi:hypothetical protein